jgi:hypothetical protein
MAETKAKPKATKPKEEKSPAEEAIDEQIAVFEPVALAVDRVLVHPDTGEEKTFVQHELGFLAKLKFFRLLSATLRLASQNDQAGVAGFLQEAIDSITTSENIGNEQFLDVLMKLVELVPDFIDEAYLLALNVRPNDQEWVVQAFETLDDETGIDIINVFVAQNGKAIQDFFGKHLQKVGATIQATLALEDTEQE